jgi:hypothetical protein
MCLDSQEFALVIEKLGEACATIVVRVLVISGRMRSLNTETKN